MMIRPSLLEDQCVFFLDFNIIIFEMSSNFN